MTSDGSARDELGRFVNGDPRPPSGAPPSGAPASRYRWAPFEPGNAVHKTHGATSRTNRFADPIATELVEALLEDRPDLAGYPEALLAWGRAEAKCLLYSEYHAKVGAFDEDGNLRGGQHYHAVERQAQKMRERLGLDPVADADLRRSQAEAVHAVVDLEGIRARGRAAIEQRRELEAGEGGEGL